MHCIAEGMGATIKPMAATHALGDNPQHRRTLAITDATLTRPNYLYALPPWKLSPCAAVVRDEDPAISAAIQMWNREALRKVNGLLAP